MPRAPLEQPRKQYASRTSAKSSLSASSRLSRAGAALIPCVIAATRDSAIRHSHRMFSKVSVPLDGLVDKRILYPVPVLRSPFLPGLRIRHLQFFKNSTSLLRVRASSFVSQSTQSSSDMSFRRSLPPGVRCTRAGPTKKSPPAHESFTRMERFSIAFCPACPGRSRSREDLRIRCPAASAPRPGA